MQLQTRQPYRATKPHLGNLLSYQLAPSQPRPGHHLQLSPLLLHDSGTVLSTVCQAASTPTVYKETPQGVQVVSNVLGTVPLGRPSKPQQTDQPVLQSKKKKTLESAVLIPDATEQDVLAALERQQQRCLGKAEVASCTGTSSVSSSNSSPETPTTTTSSSLGTSSNNHPSAPGSSNGSPGKASSSASTQSAKNGDSHSKSSWGISTVFSGIGSLLGAGALSNRSSKQTSGTKVPSCPPAVIVMFTATWCGPCSLTYKQIVRAAEELKGTDARILVVDVDKNRDFATKMRIASLPTLMFLGPNTEKPAIMTQGVVSWQLIVDEAKNKCVQYAGCNFKATPLRL